MIVFFLLDVKEQGNDTSLFPLPLNKGVVVEAPSLLTLGDRAVNSIPFPPHPWR